MSTRTPRRASRLATSEQGEEEEEEEKEEKEQQEEKGQETKARQETNQGQEREQETHAGIVATAAAKGAARVAKHQEQADDEEVDQAQDESATLPLTMTASVILSSLPQTSAAALATTWAAAGYGESKVVVRFKAVGSAPALAQDVCKISAGRRFEEVVRYVRRKLRCQETESVFLYVNSAFAPALDEVVGNLHRCFKNSHNQLIVAYSMTPAFG